ncbi:MAG: DUF4873 domain-containing protein [Actinomycetia bacterium]|nr:DUF4873 domain-containing protein [Actinomycetes bacterium]MCH9700605.1 DUF4873 domain-containing protein [Actinomycetes bacterium]MCH9759623.1 DUF4873 domain-containing protein [Actinomycetes bacterium]
MSRPESERAIFDKATHTWTVGDRVARVLIATDGALPAQPSRADRLKPYLGVAVHGFPNLFLLTGPDIAAQKGYIAKCLAYLDHTGSTRIEVRSGAQRYFNERLSGRPHRRHYRRRVDRRIRSAFELSSLGDEPEDAAYDGPAIVRVNDQSHHARVRLTGHIDPVDGHYHWQGTLFDIDFGERPPPQVVVAIGDRAAEARLTDRTPWSTYSVVGVGRPPFELGRIEVEVPLL